MRLCLKQTEEESWYESSETNNLKPDWFNQPQPTFSYTCTTNVTTVAIKGLPQLNFSSSCRVAKRERKLYLKRQDKTKQDKQENLSYRNRWKK